MHKAIEDKNEKDKLSLGKRIEITPKINHELGEIRKLIKNISNAGAGSTISSGAIRLINFKDINKIDPNDTPGNVDYKNIAKFVNQHESYLNYNAVIDIYQHLANTYGELFDFKPSGIFNLESYQSFQMQKGCFLLFQKDISILKKH